jgi:predicted CoA-substrate-specific enzyme activase
MNGYNLGIDLGSTTAKLAVLDSCGSQVYSTYRRHHAETRATLQGMLSELHDSLGDVDVSIMFTGSAGMGLSESYDLPFLQEVIAAAEVIRCRPLVHTLIDIGGEDAKMIFFDPGAPPDIRMNGACAGGTGAFIDQMATLLNLPVEKLEEVAKTATTVYPIASRCGVFAKTDVQNLLSRDIPHADILASVFNAVVYQTLATLARGRTPGSQVIFCGGPLTFIPSLRQKFIEALKIGPSDVAEIEHPELISALGAALAQDGRANLRLSELCARLQGERPHTASGQTRLHPLFDDPLQRAEWERSRVQSRVGGVKIEDLPGRPLFVGIDSGSTTTKICLTDQDGRLLFSRYSPNRGNALQTACDALAEVDRLLSSVESRPYIARSAVTGYGEDLLRAAFGCDDGVVETLAHFRAARAFEPRVSFILDIGGQDMKAIFIDQGQIRSIEINEACSSGCGTFIELFASTMGYRVGDFAAKALDSDAPCDLGTRCTVFMNSKVKQSLREGADVGDISAGLAYSVIKNAMHKVLKVTDPSVFGGHILVQGGAFRNPAVHKALENITGRKAICPDIAELMGAYGAALLARDEWRSQGAQARASTFSGLQNLDIVEQTKKQMIRCKGCENQCAITRLTFPNGGKFYTGNRCEKIYSNAGKSAYKGVSMTEIKNRLLFERRLEPDGAPRAVIGVPRALNLFENFPFWCTLLVESGFSVKLSAPSRVGMYEKGAGTITSENICFPAKLAHGHIYDLIEAGVDRIFYPMVTYENPEFNDADGVYNCPVVGGYPELINSAIDPASKHGIPLDKPAITMRDLGLLAKACEGYLTSLGVDRRTARRAFRAAIQAQRDYKQAVRNEGERIIHKARAEGRPMVMLLTRPYHIDPQIHHKAPDILTDFGVDVLTEDSIPLADDLKLDNKHVVSLWQYPNRCMYAARWAAQQPDVEVVQLNSFGCGPDAIAVDEARRTLNEWQKGHTVIRVDEIESTGSMRLRLRSMVESMRRQRVEAGLEKPGPRFTSRRTTPAFQKADRRRTILAPDFSRFANLPIVRPLRDMGYNIEILPPADRQSVEVGLKYVNNEICYPAIVVIGDVIKALQSGAYDPKEVAVGLSQTGGQCRDSCYVTLLKNGLISAGFGDVPVVSVATNFQPINEQPGLAINYPEFIYRILLTVTYADSISAMYHACAVRETTPGAAWALANEFMDALNDPNLRITPGDLQALLKQAVQRFNALPARDETYPAVGIVGEIYVKLNPFGGGGVVPWMIEQGVDVVLPPLTEYFTSNFVNWSVDLKYHLLRPDWVWMISRLVERPLEGYVKRIDRILDGFRFHRPAQSIWHMAEKASQVLALTNHFGEGWLIPGGIATLVEANVKNILCLQPFGCIANHVVAKGVQNRLKTLYPDLNLLFLDCDAGNSEVNFYNRMHFFLHHAREYA